MAERSTLICTCHARGCVDRLCTNPDTRAIVTGRLLKRSAFKEHQAEEEVWLRSHQERTAINAIASTTLFEAELPDATVHAHQGVYS